MALTSKKYSAIHTKTGSDLTSMQDKFDNAKHLDIINFEPEAAIIYQMQKMQDELDYLRTEISSNKDKTGITTDQANAITANTAKTTFPGLGTSSTTALAGDTRIPAFTADDTSVANTTKSTAITFGNFTATPGAKGTTYTLPITVVETTVVTGSKPSTTTLTKTATLTLA